MEKILNNFPSQFEIKESDFFWDQLTLGVSVLDIKTYNSIIEDFWPTVVENLKALRDIDIKSPDDEAWFHVRRAYKPHTDPNALAYAQGRLEVLRLKRGFIAPRDMENIRNLAGKYAQVACAGWWPLNFTGRHDNAFLSFLQKLSVLRGQENIISFR
jgi:hypothetical protein